ncbi:MAG: glutamyl-tRNA synthetase [Gaiellales bacterium]|jgi:glutamyl-tRNA synthetase|nr:glutamyl-tRNA synthetase [Gaiellales bacterium]
MPVRVRFAPSPTGSLHLGSALTAVANWLFARQAGGEMVLRIDDTDAERTVEGAERALEDDLTWLGLDWDEGPIRQSDRLQRHVGAATRAAGAHTRDGAIWLHAAGAPEFVIVRSDGRPTYHWATAVDEVDLRISHVIRGNDHLSNTPLQIAAIRSLGAEPPVYLHHALVRGDQGKLSKREGAGSIADLRRDGYPPEAVLNLLGLVASSGPGDVMDRDELIARFDLERLPRGEVVLETSRLRSLATAHLSRLETPDLVARVLPFAPSAATADQVSALAPALRGVHTLVEAGDLVACVTQAPSPHSLPELAKIRGRYPDQLSESQARELVDDLRRAGVPLREARLSLTGRERGPELWAVLAALPRDEAIRRAA